MIAPDPSFAISFWRLFETSAGEMLLATVPRMNENAATVMAQATIGPRWPRSACAAVEPSIRNLGSAVSRAGSTPVPISRAAESREAKNSNSPVATIGSSRTTGWGPANGRSSSAHPSGVAHRSQPNPVTVSAMTRITNSAATTIPPSSSASLRLGASCAPTAPTPAHTGITEIVASAR